MGRQYKLPEMIEVFDELPFTPTGKIQRHILIRRFSSASQREGRRMRAMDIDRPASRAFSLARWDWP